MPYWANRGGYGYEEDAAPVRGLQMGGLYGQQDVTQGSFGRDLMTTQPDWATWLDKTYAAAPGGISRGAQIGNAAIGANNEFNDISTAGRGQYDPGNAMALQGLHQAYQGASQARKPQLAGEIQRRQPFMYGRSPWGLG